ncbi:MAG: hypothetical protein FWH20_05145 [Oscillospiraceae bacterium]|nr:hypothetical protein [Oscillospiraceae bacterium]
MSNADCFVPFVVVLKDDELLSLCKNHSTDELLDDAEPCSTYMFVRWFYVYRNSII